MAKKVFTDESLSTFVDEIKSYTDEAIDKNVAIADWSVNDESNPAFVKNRTHYSEFSEGIVRNYCLPETTFDFSSQNQIPVSSANLVVGNQYIVECNGELSTVTAQETEVQGAMCVYVGNVGVMNGGTDTGEPFLYLQVPFEIAMQIGSEAMMCQTSDVSSLTISIYTESLGTIETIHHIDNKYIKDMYYDDSYVETIINEQTVNGFVAQDQIYAVENPFAFIPAQEKYTVVWDGTPYECVATINHYQSVIYIGNENYIYKQSGGDIPFSIMFFSDGMVVLATESTNESHTISISTLVKNIHKIDKKYLPETIGKASTGEGSEIFNDYDSNIASGKYSHAEGCETTASGDYSHAEGYLTEASYPYAHAEGAYTTASWWYAHAEGRETVASGEASHAEGYNNIASGWYSHVEGSGNIASNGHAEGSYVISEGHASHAEGKSTVASGEASHAEGYGSYFSVDITGDANSVVYTLDEDERNKYIQVGLIIRYENNYAKITAYDSTNLTITVDKTLNADGSIYSAFAHVYHGTIASGKYSHAEGCCTIAASESQHTQGKYNIEDTEDIYAHIVGNGVYNARSNAHTLDWSGNAWFAGDVYVGSTSGTNKDEGSKRLLKEGEGGIPIVTASSTDGVNYTATVDGMSSFTVGMTLIIIPDKASTNTSVKLNVNSLGAKSIRMPIAYNTSLTATGPVTGWLVANKPITVQWNGTYWVTSGFSRPAAQYLYGTVPVESGGTGATDAATALTNLGIAMEEWSFELEDGTTVTKQVAVSV